jgi:TatD DNase family protein
VGVHPNSRDGEEPGADCLAALAQDPRIVAIGETGLDYYRSQGDLKWQRERFRAHIRAARAARKPLIIHSREARGDVLRILEEERAADVGGVMHCFVDDWGTARRAMDLNFMISFSGIVTFRSAAELQDVARKVPLDRMLIETDAPYLAPVPHRGKENQPAWVLHVAEQIAALRGMTADTVATATTGNFFRLFPHAARAGQYPSHSS